METGAALEIVFDMARVFRAGVRLNPELNMERQDKALAVVEDFITNNFIDILPRLKPWDSQKC